MINDILKNKNRPIRILLVEDSHGDALLIKRAFERIQLKSNITLATTGEEALNLLNQDYMPDIILLDLNLPGINGLEVLKSIKNNPQFTRIPVIILSSSRAKDDVLRCYNNHANCYLAKAANLKELYELATHIEQFWFNKVILPDEKDETYEPK